MIMIMIMIMIIILIIIMIMILMIIIIFIIIIIIISIIIIIIIIIIISIIMTSWSPIPPILGAGCTVTKIGVCKFWGCKNIFLTPAHDWIHDCIRDWHMGLDLGVASSLEYKYSVTESPPGDFVYVKWWDGGPGFCEPCCESLLRVKHGFLAPISAGPCAFTLLFFWSRLSERLPYFSPSLEIGPFGPKRQAILAQLPLAA